MILIDNGYKMGWKLDMAGFCLKKDARGLKMAYFECLHLK